MENKNGNAVSPAQVAAWRTLWSVLLTPREPSDREELGKSQETKSCVSSDGDLARETHSRKEVANDGS